MLRRSVIKAFEEYDRTTEENYAELLDNTLLDMDGTFQKSKF
jgi:hypothetical protein